MAMASKPPDRTHKLTYYVSSHAVDRLRGRGEAEAYLDNDSLCRLLNDAVLHALHDSSNLRVVDDRSKRDDQGREITEEAKLVYLDSDALDPALAGGTVYALIKRNEKQDSPFKEAIVTVLTPEMVNRFFPKNGNGSGGINTSLADQLRELPRPMAKARVEKMEPEKTEQKEEQNYLVVEPEDSSGTRKMHNVSRGAAMMMVQMHANWEVYKRVKVKVTVAFEES